MLKIFKKDTQHWQNLFKKKITRRNKLLQQFWNFFYQNPPTRSRFIAKNSWKVQMNKNKYPQSQSRTKKVFHNQKRKQQIICLFAADSTSRKSRISSARCLPILFIWWVKFLWILGDLDIYTNWTRNLKNNLKIMEKRYVKDKLQENAAWSV